MSEDDIPPPLPCTYGDISVPQVVWDQIAVTSQGCWRWSGPLSPSMNPVWRRKSVWRFLYDKLCGGSVDDLPRRVPATCSMKVLCVNPDHRVPPEQRLPRLTCPTCGQPTPLQHVLDPGLMPAPEKHPAVHPAVRKAAEFPRRKRTRAEQLRGLNIQRNPLPLGDPTGRWEPTEDGSRKVEFTGGRLRLWEELDEEVKSAFNRMRGKKKLESGTFGREIEEYMGSESD